MSDFERNSWCGIGEVAGDLDRGEVRGKQVCSFQITTPTESGGITWVRVNVYPYDLVKYARNRVRRGKNVYVEGELMNRRLRGGTGFEVTEVRAFHIKVIRRGIARRLIQGKEDGQENDSRDSRW